MRALLCYKIHYYILLRMYLVSLTTELCYYLVIVIQYHDKIPLVVIELIFIILLKPLESIIVLGKKNYNIST